MADKEEKPIQSDQEEQTEYGLVKDQNIVEEMESSFLDYSVSVIVSRALPDVRDGLKPVHRRILYAMDDMNLSPGGSYKKSATVVGEVMGKYHPHGDQAIYDSMARMAQPFSSRYEMVDGQGNFGSLDGDPPAAMRYTEAKMQSIAQSMLADIKKETVDFRPNYDGSEEEPSVLPAKVPNLLLNGQMGIAVGMATNIPPHNLNELVDALIYMIENDDVGLDDLLQFVKGPDFPTGGVIYGKESIKQAYGTGRGGVVMRAVADVEEKKSGTHRIVVSEIPYGQNKAKLIEKIAGLVKDKKIKGISDLRDESSRGRVRIVIDLKRDAYPKKVLNQLFKKSPLQKKFHFNMLALIGGIQPRVLNLEMALSEYLKHRQEVIRRRSEFELRQAKDREHILQGLKKALDEIDEVITTIRESESSDDARQNLMDGFDLTEDQANAILSMQLRTLAGLERQKILDELDEVEARIEELEGILASEKEILRLVKEELEEVKEKYGDERKTEVVPHELGKFSDKELIPNKQVVVTLTAGNYIKRTPVDNYRTQRRGGKGLIGMATKEEDVIRHMVFTNTHDDVLFFTNQGRVFSIKAYELPNASRNAKGQAIVNLLQIKPDEWITAVISLDEAQAGDDNYLLMATKNGVVKKTAVEKYANIRSSGIIALKLDKGDELRWVRITDGSSQVILSSTEGQSIRFEEDDVRPMGRVTRGVRGIRLRDNDEVVGMDVVNEESQILVVTENGYGKRVQMHRFTVHNRGGLGVKTNVINDKTGKVVSVITLEDIDSEILLVSEQGQIIRLVAKNIPSMGRSTQGVRVMKLKDDDKLSSVAMIEEVEEEETEAEEEE